MVEEKDARLSSGRGTMVMQVLLDNACNPVPFPAAESISLYGNGLFFFFCFFFSIYDGVVAASGRPCH